MDTDISDLKKRRGRKLTRLTRLRRRAFVIIDVRGSRTQLGEILNDMEEALEDINEANEDIKKLVKSEAELESADKYMQDVEAQHEACAEKIREHLSSRKDEAPSVAATSHHSAHSNASAQSTREAEISARMKDLQFKQLERQLKQEQEEQALKMKRMLQVAADEREAANLEVDLRKAAETDLSWERKDDFLGEMAPGQNEREKAELVTSKSKLHQRDVLKTTEETDQRRTSSQQRRVMPEDVAGGPVCARSIPKVELGSFDGDPLDWPRWFGLFKALVHHQPHLSTTEKMVHLQSAVTGLARQTISGMLFNPDLYQHALDALEKRFGNEESIVSAHLNAVFSAKLPPVLDHANLESFYGKVNAAVSLLDNLGYTGDLHSIENLQRIVSKFPEERRREWARYVVDAELVRPSLFDFRAWLERQVEISLKCTGSSAVGGGRSTRRAAMVVTTASAVNCACCGSSHYLERCPQFLRMPVDGRLELVVNQGLCFFCFCKDHRVRGCKDAITCQIEGCTMKHHETLHGSQRISFNRREPRASHPVSQRNEESARRTVAAADIPEKEGMTLLQIVPVRVHGVGGKFKDTHALLDPGAQTSLCQSQVLEDLGIQGEVRNLSLLNVEGPGKSQRSQRVKLELSPLSPCEDQKKILVPEAFAVPHINVEAPNISQVNQTSWHHLSDLELPNYEGAVVELVLGANVLEAVLQKEVRVGQPGQPVAIRTAFGWTLSGSVAGFIPGRTRQVMFLRKVDKDEEMTELLQKWWTTDSFGTMFNNTDTKSRDDMKAIEKMEKTTKYLGDRYETGLLWKDDNVHLPNNKPMAMSRLQSLERSLQRQPERAIAYRQTIQSYIDSGFARRLSSEEERESHPRKWYLPHHAVINVHKPGKVRVVFDAAAECHGTSLNDVLLTGPDLLRSLCGVLLRFREERVALVADIESMYHQVRVRKEDEPALSFLWRDLDVSKPPDTYRMGVTIFGAKSSPASANFVLQKTAKDHCEESEAGQVAAEAVRQNFYMDDLLRSEKTETAAKQMQQEMSQLLARGGFRLAKWRSNSKQVLADVRNEDRAHTDLSNAPESVLGCIWDPGSDTLSIREVDVGVVRTKRDAVRAVAKLFDPLGVLGPVVLRAKLQIQRLWAKQYGWDDELEEGELMAWTDWTNELQQVSEIKIPRCLKQSVEDEDCIIELHVFGDASEGAFGAAAYAKVTALDGSSTCNLIMSKSRLSPLKQISIVRLELQAAVMVARIANMLRHELCYKFSRTFLWSDSKAVLQYLRCESRRFHTFVANRVSEIRETSELSQWKYVPGKQNPADACSRVKSVSSLKCDSSWWNGPVFLERPEEFWPVQDLLKPVMDEDPEARVVAASAVVSSSEVLPSAERFSSWTRYRRVVAWIIRFVRNFTATNKTERKKDFRSGPLSATEIKGAELEILRESQRRNFSEEIRRVKQGIDSATTEQFHRLSPFISDDGLLRVGGRLDKAPVSFSVRHPIILASRDETTRLIVSHRHSQVLHSGLERTLTEVRQQFWIPKSRSTVRRILHGCSVCKRRRVIPQPPRMADLPDCRFDTSRAFGVVGVDYFGPMTVTRLRKSEKRYGVLFTCLGTRAIHLEIAHSLDTDSFLMALRRFLARRGKPDVLYSDNGSNFVGGDRELRQSLKELNNTKLQDALSQQLIQWSFIPPGAPHMGGAWERLVGSVKRALKIIPGYQSLTDEVLLTLMTEIEAMINGRPLTYVSSDAQDPEPLTPNHLIMGCSCPNLSPGVFRDKEINSRRRWRQSQVLAQHFWTRWRREYIPTLMHRSKWSSESRNLQEGDVVLMVDGDAPRGFWPLARVTKGFSGSDGVVRSVELKTAAGCTYRRPAQKVCFLEETT